MRASPYIDADRVQVAVEDGTASLTGSVESWMEYHAAMENALEGGASWVHNNIEVGGR